MTARRVVAIVGPTASGKTAIAELLARELDGEVVCADSRQVFRELDIGTGKPTVGERADRVHHLFDTLSVGEQASAGWYVEAARKVCAAIWARGRMPVFVGGSGLYLRAARRGLAATPPHDPDVRARLMEELETSGPEALHARLRVSDLETAARVEPRDRQRIVRALEVAESTGQPLSWWHRQAHGPAVGGTWRVFELTRDPDLLRDRIARRTTWMFEHGLCEETRTLLGSAHAEALRSLRAIGYDEAIELIEGRLEREAAETRTNHRTAQLAKRQRTWFRHQMASHAIKATDTTRAAEHILAAWEDDDH